MSNSLRTSEDYELFIYTIADQFPSVRRSTVALILTNTYLQILRRLLMKLENCQKCEVGDTH